MNREHTLASFQVHVTSVENGTWAGFVEANDITYHFKSELQLLRWLMEQFPSLNPEPAQFQSDYPTHKEV